MSEEFKWIRIAGILRWRLEEMPYFVDKVNGIDFPYVLYGIGMARAPGTAAFLDQFLLLKDAKAVAERLAAERVLPEG